MQTSLDGLYFYNFLRWTACCEKESKTKSVVHERIQGGGGGPGQSDKKSSNVFFCFFLSPQLILQKSNGQFQSNISFFKVSEGV